jgi:hypothetical protein
MFLSTRRKGEKETMKRILSLLCLLGLLAMPLALAACDAGTDEPEEVEIETEEGATEMEMETEPMMEDTYMGTGMEEMEDMDTDMDPGTEEME